MRTTVDLPDELLRTVRIRAASENRTLKHVLTDLVRRGLAATSDENRDAGHRVQLPLVLCEHEAAPGNGLTPARVNGLLDEHEVAGVLRP